MKRHWELYFVINLLFNNEKLLVDQLQTNFNQGLVSQTRSQLKNVIQVEKADESNVPQDQQD